MRFKLLPPQVLVTLTPEEQDLLATPEYARVAYGILLRFAVQGAYQTDEGLVLTMVEGCTEPIKAAQYAWAFVLSELS